MTTELNSLLNPLDPAWLFGHRHYSPGDLVPVFERAGLEVEDMRINGDVSHCPEAIAFYIAKHVFDAGSTGQSGCAHVSPKI